MEKKRYIEPIAEAARISTNRIMTGSSKSMTVDTTTEGDQSTADSKSWWHGTLWEEEE